MVSLASFRVQLSMVQAAAVCDVPSVDLGHVNALEAALLPFAGRFISRLRTVARTFLLAVRASESIDRRPRANHDRPNLGSATRLYRRTTAFLLWRLGRPAYLPR